MLNHNLAATRRRPYPEGRRRQNGISRPFNTSVHGDTELGILFTGWEDLAKDPAHLARQFPSSLKVSYACPRI